MLITVKNLRALLREVLLLEGEAISADQAKEIAKKFPKGMKKNGIDVDKIDSLPVLGTGTRGTAFDIGNGKVLKITNDSKEAQAASVMVGKDVKNIVSFYAVWQFGDTGFYGITQEKLQPLPNDDANDFNKALVATGLPIWIKRAEGSWDKAKQLTKEYIIEQVKKKFGGNLKSPEAATFAKDVNNKWNLLVTKYGIRDMFKTLSEFGIDFHDYHAGNMMQRADGTMVLIDLGMSKIKGDGKVQTMNERN